MEETNEDDEEDEVPLQGTAQTQNRERQSNDNTKLRKQDRSQVT